MIYKTISPTESQVGKYVDINGDGIPEGVIFADLAVGGRVDMEINMVHAYMKFQQDKNSRII